MCSIPAVPGTGCLEGGVVVGCGMLGVWMATSEWLLACEVAGEKVGGGGLVALALLKDFKHLMRSLERLPRAAVMVADWEAV